jgi:hypothetical protein
LLKRLSGKAFLVSAIAVIGLLFGGNSGAKLGGMSESEAKPALGV